MGLVGGRAGACLALEVSVGCELVSTGHSYRHYNQTSGHERLPLGQGGRAAELVSLAIDEVAFRVEVVVQAGVN